MKIVADEAITGVEKYFSRYGSMVLKPGRLICHEDVRDAAILLVRSITPVNALLLENTAVQFVGSATSGTDHLDMDWLKQANIKWSAAPGCNAIAVAEYVVCVIAALQKQGIMSCEAKKAAVIGVGHVGSCVVKQLQALQFDVVQCDPLRAIAEPDFPHVACEAIKDVDVISIHTSLTHHDLYPSYHLIEKHFLQRQKKGAVLLNASRGAVISFNDLKKYGLHLQWCLDVWEHEPEIEYSILEKACIATPHIAGYTRQSKLRATEMLYHAAIAHGLIMPDLPVDSGVLAKKSLLVSEWGGSLAGSSIGDL